MSIKIMGAVFSDIMEAFKADAITITPKTVHSDYTDMLAGKLSLWDLTHIHGHNWVAEQQELFKQIAEESECDITV